MVLPAPPLQGLPELPLPRLGDDDRFSCDCPLGYRGETCDTLLVVTVPWFTASSHLRYAIPDEAGVRHGTRLRMDVCASLAWLGLDSAVDTNNDD